MSPSHRNSLHLCRHPSSPDFLPRASGEAADVALCSRRPRQRRWAQTRSRVGGGVRPWRSSGDDPGKGAESRAPWAPCEAANGAGSPPPSPAFAAISFCYATRTLSVPATPKPPHPGRTPYPSFRRGQKKPRRWSKARGIPDPEGNCKTQKVGRALLRQKWADGETGVHVARPTTAMPNQGQRVGCEGIHSKAARWHWRMQAVR